MLTKSRARWRRRLSKKTTEEDIASLKGLARIGRRAGEEFRWVTEADLRGWARSRQLSLWRAYWLALAEGVFPESLERNFPSLSAAEQLRLWDSRVLVAGLGGLGGMVAVLLARLGVARLWLADGDVFTPGNLNRQCLATWPSMGKNKAKVAARQLRRINPALKITDIPEFLTLENLPRHLGRVQVVMDCLDTVRGRQELWAAAREAGLAMVHGAVLGNFGQVATFLPDDHPGSLALIYGAWGGQEEELREVLAPVVSLVAGLQVQEALRFLLGKPLAYHRRLAHVDGDTGRWEVWELD